MTNFYGPEILLCGENVQWIRTIGKVYIMLLSVASVCEFSISHTELKREEIAHFFTEDIYLISSKL